MEVITWTILVLTSLVSFFFLTSKHMRSTKGKRLPPGPIGFPVLGSLHLLGKSPHRDLHKLAQKYGPIMHLRLGQVPNIVASSPEAAELFLKTHDLVFASRPPLEASRLISYGQKNLVFGPYGPYWRNIRKLCTLELLSNHKVSSFRYIRKEEVGLLVQLIQEASTDRLSVDISAKVSSFVADMSCRMIFGKKYCDKDLGGEEPTSFKAVMHEISQVAAVPNLSDFVPFASPFDLQGLRKRMTKVREVVDVFLERIIDEHLSGDSDKRKSKDFVDVMLGILESESSDYQIDRDGIKALMLDMFAASVDTSGSAIEWTLSELLKHPIVMEKLRMELESKVGLNRTVDELDLENLEYLWMVVKETMRLHPVAPILIHASMEDFTVKDFFIPKDSRVLVNLWAIGRDPSVWVEPDKFMPERFKSSNIDLHGRDFQLTPFGAGRRSCPGMHLGLTVVGHVVAQLVHCFDWELPDGMVPSELDMAEEFGLVMSRAKHLVAVPRFRLLI